MSNDSIDPVAFLVAARASTAAALSRTTAIRGVSMEAGSASERAELARIERNTAMVNRDTRFLKKIHAIWKARPGVAGGTIQLPSGRVIPASGSAGGGERRPGRGKLAA